MNVALCFPGCHRRGGVERVLYECAHFLAERGHDAHVYANQWETDGVAVHYHHVPMPRQPYFIRDTCYYRSCTKLLRGRGHGVLSTHGCICPTDGVHWVQSVHRAWLERAREFRPAFSAAWLMQKLNPLHPMLLHLEATHFRRRRYRKVIATTQQVRCDLGQLYDVPAGDVVVIPNGFSPSEFNPQRCARRREDVRRELGLTSDNVVLLFAANELERKGYATILAALRLLNRPELRVLVVGRPAVRRVMQLAADAGVADQVIACGPTSDIARFHAAADLFVLPTQYEAFSLGILEALGSGLPVVTSDVPGARDAIRAGVNGVLVREPCDGEELAAALRPLLDATARAALAAGVAESVRSYQWPAVLERYEQVLQACAR